MDEPGPTGQPRIRVLVVDADDRVRESLAGLLAIGRQVDVVGSARDPGSALELIASTPPDLVIIDPRLPELDRGIAFIEYLRKHEPGLRVVVMNWSDVLEDRLARCDADGFVRKTFRPAELLAAIRAAGTSAAH
jgi:DNA-binding NarL/FixJ family response regulator